MHASDPVSVRAIAIYLRALWYHAESMILTYGAWGGIIVTGSVAWSLRRILGSAELVSDIFPAGPYAKRILEVPRALGGMHLPELVGAAAALRLVH